MPRFILYGTVGCHLCEVAETQLAALLAEPLQQRLTIAIECIDISVDEELMARYGERIPVLQRVADNAEVNWPFDADELRELLQN